MADSQLRNSESLAWEAFLGGDHQAFERLFKSYYNALFQYARRYHHQEDLAHECVQQLFCQLWQSRGRLSLVENVKAYLFKALRTYLQREAVYQKRLLTLDCYRPITFSREDFITQDETDTYRKKAIADTLNLLPQRQREVIYLKYYENLSYPEIADVLHINYQSVVNLVFRAIQRLRQEEQLHKISVLAVHCMAVLLFL